MSRSKKYREVSKDLDVSKLHALEEACELVVKTQTTKFDSAVDIHINLSIDPKQADQQIRSTVSLPHGTGKTKVVAAFVGEDKIKEAKAAGADYAGAADLIAKVKDKNWTDFDIAVATPDMMKDIAKIGKILGTKGLMPNPKSGTVTTDVVRTIQEIKQGRVELRNDPHGILHVSIGRVSFGQDKILANAKLLLDTVKKGKPGSTKGNYIKSVTICTTMGPGIKIDPLHF